MKRVLLIGMAAILLAAGVGLAAGEVPSVNVVGYIKTEVPADSWALISLPFMNMDTSVVTMTIEEVIPAAATPVGTKAWFYRADDNSWKHETVTAAGPSKYWWDSAAAGLGTNEFIRGDALFINTPPGDGVALSVKGEVPGDNNLAPTTTVVLAGSGWTLVGFAYPVDTYLTNALPASLLTVGDKLWEYDGTWQDNARVLAAGPSKYWNDQNYVLKAGVGYFFNNAGGQVDWEQTKPYTSP